jgi:catechol 2,3-dioxygenase-like lactoylglutathione lyase family enzyme
MEPKMTKQTNHRSISHIDHIHIYVSDKQLAATWYKQHLGFHVVDELTIWDTQHGPLMLANDSKTVHLALFEVERFAPIKVIAFATSGKGLLAWHQYLSEQNLLKRSVDHQLCWSLYFDDPFGHNHEITTDDVDLVRQALATEPAT